MNEVSQDQVSAVAQMPDQYNVERTKEWYKENVLFIASKYNPVIESMVTVARANGVNQEAGKRNPDWGRWATNVYRNISYYYGEQNNTNYGYFLRDVKNNPLPARLINGQTIFQLCKHIQGFLQDTYIRKLNERVSVRDVTPDFMEERFYRFELAELGIDLKYAQSHPSPESVVFKPVQGQDFSSIEQLEKYKEENTMERVERIFTAAAINFLYEIDWRATFKKINDYLVPCYFACVHPRVEGDKIKLDVFRPDQCIFDTSVDDEYGTKARYGGVIRYMTVPEVIQQYGDVLSDKDKEDLQHIAKSGRSQNVLLPWYPQANTAIFQSGYYWWDWSNSIPRAAVMTAYWKGLDESGKEVLYRADYIGNKFLVREGLADIMVEDKMNEANVEFPFIYYMPDFIFGKNKGFVDRLASISDRIDGLEAKIDLIINRAKGKVVFVNGSEMNDGGNVAEMLADISTMGVHIVQGVDIDDAREKYGDRLITLADMTVDYNGITSIRNEIREKIAESKSIVSIPDSVLGQQTPQGSNKELLNTIQQASYGMATFYDGYLTFVNKVVQRGTDLRKILMTKNPKSTEFMVSEGDAMFVAEVLPEWSLKKMRAVVDQDDFVTAEDRARYSQILFAYAQNPESGLEPEDVFAIDTMTSKREIKNYVAWKGRVRRARQEIAAQQEMEAKQRLAETNSNTMLEQTAMNNQSAEQQNMDKIEGKLMEKSMGGQA